MIRRPPSSPLFPYTPLFRSLGVAGGGVRSAPRRRYIFHADTSSVTHTMATTPYGRRRRSEEHTSELQSRLHLVCRLLLEKKKETNAFVSVLRTRRAR